MHERERVDELDGRCGGQDPAELEAERVRSREADDRADALAAERVPHGGLEGAELRRQRQLVEVALDERAQLLRRAGHPAPGR